MKKQIKFRAYNSDTKEIISWDQIGDDNWDLWNEFLKCDTIMQFIGIKDKNGVDIYEGDIVNYHSDISMQKYRGIVLFNEITLQFVAKFDYTDFSDYMEFRRTDQKQNIDISSERDNKYTVVGNMHQNPELLFIKEKKPQTITMYRL